MLAIGLAVFLTASTPSPSASASTPPADLPKPTDAERAAFERGRSYQRVILANEDRKWYGIPLLGPTFSSDLDTLASGQDFPEANVAQIVDPLRMYLESGDRTSLPAALGDINAFMPYADKPPPDGKTWWFVQAGMADADVRAAGDNPALQALADVHSRWLQDHASLGGPYGQALGSAPTQQSFDDVVHSEAGIESLFEGMFPATPFVTVTYPKGPMGYARLGMTMQTISQMLDSPTLLAQPQSQAFVDAVVRQLETVTGTAIPAALLSSYRSSLVVDADFDHARAYSVAQDLTGRLIKSLSKSDQGCYFVGMLSTQAVYNAVVFRDTGYVVTQLGALRYFDQLDTTDPAAAALRRWLSAASPTDWPSQIDVGRKLVYEIETHS